MKSWVGFYKGKLSSVTQPALEPRHEDDGVGRVEAPAILGRLVVTRAPRAAWAAWVAVCVIWGTTYLGIRVSLETIPPVLMSGIRWTVAGLLVATVLLARGQALPGPRAWPGLALLSVLMIGIGNGFVVWAEQYVPSGLTAVVLATSPFWMVAVEGTLHEGEALTGGTLGGLLLGFGGILLLVWPDLHAGGLGAVRFGTGVVALQ